MSDAPRNLVMSGPLFVQRGQFDGCSVDGIKIGGRFVGETKALADLEMRRAGSAAKMRSLFFTGSPYGREILTLAEGAA